MTDAIEIAVTINGRGHRLAVPPRRVLADVLREDLQLLGCKIGCDQAVCGACTVLVDDLPVTACTTFAFEIDGKAVTTIEDWRRAAGTIRSSGLSLNIAHFSAASARRA